MALLRLQFSPDQTAVVTPLIREARQLVGPTGESRTFAPSVIFGEVDLPCFDPALPHKDMARAEFRCGVVSAKAARKIRKILDEEALRQPPAAPPPRTQTAHRVVAVDFETAFDTDYSVKKLGYYAYANHPRFNAYLVSIWADDGWHWVGHPKDAPWDEISGATWLSHNAQFDRAVFFRLQESGIISKTIAPEEWHCTSALSVYLAAPRNLAGAAKELVGMRLDKSTRSNACGYDGQSLFGQSPEMLAYALKDAEACCRIWITHADKWPLRERRLSAQTVASGERGVQVDLDYIQTSASALEKVLAQASARIPWAKHAAPTSTKELTKACRVTGIEPPASTAEDSEEFEAWQEKHGARIPWVAAMQTYRRANRKLKILQAALTRCKPGGEMTFSLKYFGGFTGRWSGDTGLNLQNLNKEKDFDVDMRRMLIPRPGYVFVICDLSQIEPRCLAYLSGNWPLLERIAAGESIYEAHARATMGWTGGPLKKENPRLYGLAKARVLGLGYQCAAERFVAVARIMGGIEITLAEAEKTVADFRRSNPLITGLWAKLEREFVSKHGKTYFLKLPSGRYLRYFDVHADTMTAANERGGTRYAFYGGKLVENYIQASARDVFAENILRVEDAGYPVLFHVHDEVITEVPISQAEAAKTEIERLMSVCPTWLEGCPLAAEAVVASHYLK
ncbi:MAG: DNA polymerase [Chthoniobacteraceae bacterium]